MTTVHPTESRPVRDDLRPARRPSRTWAWAGVGAAVLGLASTTASGLVDAVYATDSRGDAEKIQDALSDSRVELVVFHLVTILAAVLLVPFGLGLARRLAGWLPADSLLPGAAAAGILLTSGVLVLGSGLDTEFLLDGPDGTTLAENASMYNHWIATIPWLWVMAGLAGVVVHLAARAGAVTRWIGLVGLVLGGLTLLLGISPLQYMAGMTGPIWLLVTAVGFAVGDRASRA